MPYSLENRLVLGIASSAIFDLSESDAVFRERGEAAYRRHQQEMQSVPLPWGHSLGFIRRLLALNDLSPDPARDPLVEVILLSKNDPDTGLRIMESIRHHGLSITRAVFRQGECPHRYIPALNISLFLSGDPRDVHSAIEAGLPAGHVLGGPGDDDPVDRELRVAFDFDGVLADDTSETVYRESGEAGFHDHEAENVGLPHGPGPLRVFLGCLAAIQRVEASRHAEDPGYLPRVRISIVTARNAPSERRAIQTLRSWGVVVNDAFFLGGIEKAKVLGVLRPHIFFDEQKGHLIGASGLAPTVHIPYGRLNKP